jgi:hypothetical protein
MCVSRARPLTSPTAYSQSKPSAHGVVDLDRPARLEADRLEAKVAGERTPADGDEQLVAADVRAVLERHDHPVALAPHRCRLGADADVDAALAQRLRDLRARERLLAREQPRQHFDQRHPRAER